MPTQKEIKANSDTCRKCKEEFIMDEGYYSEETSGDFMCCGCIEESNENTQAEFGWTGW